MRTQFEKRFALIILFTIISLFLFVQPVFAVDRFTFTIQDISTGNSASLLSDTPAVTLYTTTTSLKITIEPAEYIEEGRILEKVSYPFSNGWQGTQVIGNGGGMWTVSGLNAGADYTFQAFIGAAQGYSDAQATIYVKRGATPPTVSLSVLPGYSTTNVSYGTYKPLQWNSTNATSCSASWTSSTATSGSGLAGPAPDQSTVTYSTTCTGSGGSTTSNLTFTVNPVCGDNYCTNGENSTSCSVDCPAATLLCGNGVTDNSGAATETCDWGNSSTPSPNNGDVCTLNYGDLYCTYCSTSCQWTNNTANAKYCGDNFITSPPEQCDGTNYNGTTCQTLGYQSGQIGCYPASAVNPSQNCTFNTNNCVSYPSGGVCGDGQKNLNEQCDTGSARGSCPATCSLSCTTNDCGGVPPVGECVMTSATWTNFNTTSGSIVSLIVDGVNCSGKTVSLKVFEYDAVGTDVPAQTHPVNVIFSGNRATGGWITEWMDDGLGQGDPEYYFTATVSGATGSPISSGTASNQLLTVSQANALACASVATCGDYADLTSCTLDECTVAASSVPSTIDCSATGTDCYCSWDSGTSGCNPVVDGPAGLCTITQGGADTCDDDGFLTFSWTAVWTFATGKNATDDVNGLQAKCVDGSKTIECPAQIALPFVSTYSIISVLVVIALVYWALSMRKLKRVKSSGKKKRR